MFMEPRNRFLGSLNGLKYGLRWAAEWVVGSTEAAGLQSWPNGTPTKRQVSQVSKHQVSKRPVSKRLVSKRKVYKTSGLQNVRFQNVRFQNVWFQNVHRDKASKRPVFKFDILIKGTVA